MKKLAFLFAFLLFSLTVLQANNSLKIVNPDWWGGESPGTIEEAVFTVEPKGLYMEVGMYLTFSAAGGGWWQGDSLEIVLDFDLPDGSIVHDSWLWIDNFIMKAGIMDIWTATAIYEEIVDRRRDPSILYKKPGGGYQIRIYPLPGNQTRKVKITYLSPAVWNGGSVTTSLPTEILLTSYNPLNQFKVFTKASGAWADPVLAEYPGVVFQNETFPQMTGALGVTLPASAASLPLTFSVKSPAPEGVFVNRWEEPGGKFYQLAYLPEAQPSVVSPKKCLLIINHDTDKTYIKATALWEYVKKMLRENLAAQDSFNIIFAKPNGFNLMSQHWISKDSTALEALLAQFPSPVIEASQSEKVLLEAGINFIKNNGGNADIFFFASSIKTYPSIANNVAADLWNLIGSDNIPIHVINYQTEDYYFEWDEPDILRYHNQPFYKKLTQVTSGNLYSSLDGGGPVWETMLKAFTDWKAEEAVFDLYCTLGGGFTYQRFHQNYLGQSSSKNRPVLQTGKYEGSFPMTVIYSAVGPSGVVFEIKTISESQVFEADSLSRGIWTGSYLNSLEGGNPGNSTIQHIIDVSIAERVLSNYTAFLALEPNMEPCFGCWYDGGIIIIDTEEKNEEAWSLNAFPNPFSDRVNIEIKTGGDPVQGDFEIKIFDSFGRWVRDLTKQAVFETGGIQLQWDGAGHDGTRLPAGVYHLVVRNGTEVSTIKLMIIR
jgi:hypothetical protein